MVSFSYMKEETNGVCLWNNSSEMNYQQNLESVNCHNSEQQNK